MNTSRAITEPLHKLQRTHERINRTVKALTASVRHLFRPTAPELPGPLELLIRKETECWDQPHVFGSGSVVEDEAIAEIADAGLVRAFSSLDDYVSGIEAELDRAGLGVSAGGTAANRSGSVGTARFVADVRRQERFGQRHKKLGVWLGGIGWPRGL